MKSALESSSPPCVLYIADFCYAGNDVLHKAILKPSKLQPTCAGLLQVLIDDQAGSA